MFTHDVLLKYGLTRNNPFVQVPGDSPAYNVLLQTVLPGPLPSVLV